MWLFEKYYLGTSSEIIFNLTSVKIIFFQNFSKFRDNISVNSRKKYNLKISGLD